MIHLTNSHHDTQQVELRMESPPTTTTTSAPVEQSKKKRFNPHIKTRFVAALCPCCDKTDYDGPGVEHDTRYCGDPWFLVLFVLFWIGMFIIAAFGIRNGNPVTMIFTLFSFMTRISLVQPTDYQRNVCGRALGQGNHNKYDLTDRPKLWYPFSLQITLNDGIRSTLKDALSMGICVKECPTAQFNLDEQSPDSIVCDYEHEDLDLTDKIQAALNGQGCYINHFITAESFKRCVPVITNSTVASLDKLFGKTLAVANGFKRSIAEVYNSYIPLIVAAAVTLLLCVLFVVMLRLFVGPVVVFTIVFVFVCVAAAGAYASWTAYNKYVKSRPENNKGIVDEETLRNAKVWAVIGGVLDAACLLYLGIVVFLLRRIGRAIRIIREASKAVIANWTLVIVPPISFFFIIAVTVYWIIIGAYLQSCSRVITISPNSTATFAKYAKRIEKLQPFISLNMTQTSSHAFSLVENGTALQYLQLYHLFGWFWSVAFIQAISYTVIAGVIGTWYFSGTGGERKARKLEVFYSFGRTFFWHLGSLAFGALIVAIVQMLRYLFNKLKKQLDKYGGNTTKWTTRVLTGVLWVLEKIVRFINKNAYIIIAIKGRDFCRSSVQAFKLIVANILTVGVVNFLSDFILFLGKVLITAVGGIVCYLIIDLNARYGGNIAPGVKIGIVPTVVSVFINFILASLYMNLYDTTIDTILICYCFDRKHNDGSPNKPYHMSDKEHDAIFKKKKKRNDSDSIKMQVSASQEGNK